MTQLGMLQWPEELAMFDAFMQERAIQTALEIGTGPGGFTQWLGKRLSGMLISVDLPSGASSGLSHDACVVRNRQLVEENSRFVGILGDSHSAVVFDQVHMALRGAAIDLLFIDGDHSFGGVSRDYEDYRYFVRPGGVIAFHDINADAFESHGVDVPRFWRGLVGSKREFSVHGEWGGIGVLLV